jgi:hypothetical protein
MPQRTCSTDQRTVTCSPVRERTGQQRRALHQRFGRVTLGFWLGGLALGTVGGIVGAAMPYSHPIARAVSALWWGIYCGCLGASLGAILGIYTERAPASASESFDDAEQPGVEGGRPACPDNSGRLVAGHQSLHSTHHRAESRRVQILRKPYPNVK